MAVSGLLEYGTGNHHKTPSTMTDNE